MSVTLLRLHIDQPIWYNLGRVEELANPSPGRGLYFPLGEETMKRIAIAAAASLLSLSAMAAEAPAAVTAAQVTAPQASLPVGQAAAQQGGAQAIKVNPLYVVGGVVVVGAVIIGSASDKASTTSHHFARP
jgi:hypothetical protein